MGENQCRNDRWLDIYGHPKLRLISGRKIFGCHGRSLLNFLSNDPLLHQMHYLQILELHHCLKITKRLSNHLNLEFESEPAAATRSLVLLPNLFFIELFSIRVLLFCCCFLSIYTCASTSIDQAE